MVNRSLSEPVADVSAGGDGSLLGSHGKKIKDAVLYRESSFDE